MISPRPVGPQQLFLILLERIERGHYSPGTWLPAERALAQEFGMDRSAVRRALTQLEDRGLIVRESGKRPWVRGRHDAPRQDGARAGEGRPRATGLGVIAAVLPQHPVYPASLAVLHGINAALRSTEAPYRLQVLDTHGGSECRETAMECRALESVAEEDIAGVVLWHMGGAQTLPQIQALESRGTPVVFVDRYPPGVTCDFVGSDNHAAVESAIQYLRHLGHRRIAHLTTDERTTAVAERREAYAEAMQAGEPAHGPGWVFEVPHDDTANVAGAYAQFAALPDPPTAVFAMNDSLAYQFILECQRHGRSVPEDVSVVGFDDLERHSLRPALLTTLHQPFDSMGRRAAGLLLRRLTDSRTVSRARQHILLPAPLIKRSTCHAPRKADADSG